jgi:hypothetical protein
MIYRVGPILSSGRGAKSSSSTGASGMGATASAERMPKTNADYWTAKIRRNVARDETNVGRLAATLYELAGPNIFTYEELLSTLALGRRPLLLPFPFALWHVVGYLSEFLPNPPMRRRLMYEGKSLSS